MTTQAISLSPHPPLALPRAYRRLRKAQRRALARMWSAEEPGHHRCGPGSRGRFGGPGMGAGFGSPQFGGFGGPRGGGFGGPRGGGFGGPRGGGFGGPRGGFGRRARRARRGDVRIALLLLLLEESRNGYGLMQEIERRSEGRWRPSPGSVYPALAQLEDEGLVRSQDDEAQTGRSFTLTDAGRAEVQARGADQPAPWEAQPDPQAEPGHELGGLVEQLAGATMQVAQAGDPAQVVQARDLLSETRRALYRILAEDHASEHKDR